MIEFDELKLVTWQCIHFAKHEEVQASLSRLAADDVFTAVASMKEASNADDMLAAVSQALRFPGYFGKNWDALTDCLRDLEWLAARAYVLVLCDMRQFWSLRPAVVGALIECWLTAAEQWSHEAVPFHLVFSMDED